MDKVLNKLRGLEYILECIKQYHRPLITVFFSSMLGVIFYKCVLGGLACELSGNSIIRELMYIMLSYIGIYAGGRTYEKVHGRVSKQEVEETLAVDDEDSILNDDNL